MLARSSWYLIITILPYLEILSFFSTHIHSILIHLATIHIRIKSGDNIILQSTSRSNPVIILSCAVQQQLLFRSCWLASHLLRFAPAFVFTISYVPTISVPSPYIIVTSPYIIWTLSNMIISNISISGHMSITLYITVTFLGLADRPSPPPLPPC